MRVLFCILLTIMSFSLFANSVKDRVVQDCQGYKVDPDCMYEMLEKYDPKLRDQTFFMIPSTWKSKRSKGVYNGHHVYVTRYKAFIAYRNYCDATGRDCYMEIPEHSGVSGTKVLQDSGLGWFNEVDAPNEEPYPNIESGLVCDPNDTRTICNVMSTESLAIRNLYSQIESVEVAIDDVRSGYLRKRDERNLGVYGRVITDLCYKIVKLEEEILREKNTLAFRD